METKHENIDIYKRLGYEIIKEAFKGLVEIHSYLYWEGIAVVALKHKQPLFLNKSYGSGNLLNTHAGGIISHTNPIHFCVRSAQEDNEILFISKDSSIIEIKWNEDDESKYTLQESMDILRNSLQKIFDKGIYPCGRFHGKDWTKNKTRAVDHMNSLAKWWYTTAIHSSYMLK